MKKYFMITVITALFFTGCVKDELPQAPAPAPEDYSNIVVNELISKDTSNVYFVDESGKACDWIELYNKGNKAVNIAGMWITDNPGTEADYNQIPNGADNVTTIPPKGFVVLICGAKDAGGTDLPTSIANGKIFINMGLSSSKDHEVALYTPDKSDVDVSGDFGGLPNDKSFGRSADGAGEWMVMANKTPGAPNDGSAPAEGTLVINEFMASNDSWNVPGDNGDQPDWIEIYNTGDTPIDMGGWFVSDAIDTPDKYQLPADNATLTTVAAHGFLVLVCDGTGEGLHTNFKLSGGGEEVAISKNGVDISDGYSYCDSGCDLLNPGTDNSTGRDGDGATTWVVYQKDSSREPTPGTSNN